MRLEEEIFKKSRFIPEKLIEYGFETVDKSYVFSKLFLNNEFEARIIIDSNYKIYGKVIDKSFDEEYSLLRVENNIGSFALNVKNEYVNILSDIKDKCTVDVLFNSDQANRITNLIEKEYDILPNFPWNGKKYSSYGTFKHDNGKWFGIIMDVKKSVLNHMDNEGVIDVINVKRDLNDNSLIDNKSIFEGYHMNHKLWISIVLDDSLSDDFVLNLIKISYNLTK